jgi:glycosyltransferase involved in cell wall biosynthesis
MDPARILFRGYTATDQIYDEVDGLIVCNEREPSGRTVGEAMLRSKVVFAPDRGGALEYFENSVTGFEYRALDAQSLTRSIEEAFEPERDLPLLGRRAREKILTERSPRHVAEKYFDALSRTAAQKRLSKTSS